MIPAPGTLWVITPDKFIILSNDKATESICEGKQWRLTDGLLLVGPIVKRSLSDKYDWIQVIVNDKKHGAKVGWVFTDYFTKNLKPVA